MNISKSAKKAILFGFIVISVGFAQPLEELYDFNDGNLPIWGGPANMEIINGTLKLSSTSTVSWVWNIFDSGFPGSRTFGSFAFDVKFGSEGYFFDFRGHSESNISDLNWGPRVEFQNNLIFPRIPGYFNSNISYVNDVWYRVRAEFDNSRGARGKYLLYLKNLSSNSPEVKLGDFDYYASNGRLIDIVQFSFGLRTLGSSSATMYIDNVNLKLAVISTGSVTISGKVVDTNGLGLSGATVSFSNGGATVNTDAGGYYSTSVSSGWSGTSSASKSGYTFSPANYSYSAVSTDQVNQNFNATKTNASVSISGYIRDNIGNPLAGAAITFSNGGATVYTDATGYYNTSVSTGWGGTSTPLLMDWNFTPTNYSYSALTANTADQDFSGNEISLGITDYESLPINLTLTSAYPNPFNPSTTIGYGLPENGNSLTSKTTIQIFDIRGKLIKTLTNKYQSSGWHSIQWNGSNQYNQSVPAGAYLVRVNTGTEVKSLKVLLLK